jgi:hypothetical protein
MNVYSHRNLRSTSVTVGGSLMILALQGCVMNRGSAVNESAPGSLPQASGPATQWREEFEGGSQAAEDALIKQAIDAAMEAIPKNKAALGVPFSVRDAHPKAHGCLKGTFEVLDNIPAAYRIGLFSEPKTYKVWARFSNAGLMTKGVKDDRNKDARGMALKVIDVPGSKLLPGKEDSPNFDMNLVNVPVFPAENINQYIKLQTNPIALGVPGVGVLGRVLQTLARVPENHPFGFPYFSITSFKLGAAAIKYRAKPCTDNFKNRVAKGPDYLRLSIEDAFSKKEQGCFELQAQTFVDAQRTPIETPVKEWTDEVAPFETVARVVFAPQKFNSAAQVAFCEALSFNPWRVTEDHRPLGRLNRARLQVYTAISVKRHEDNSAPEAEPNGNESF